MAVLSIPVLPHGLQPTVVPLQPLLEHAWDAYVVRHPRGSPFHLLAWKSTIEASFNYVPHYLAAVRDGVIHGVLPLFHVRNFIVGSALISSPFAVYGGILADSEADRRALYSAARNLGASLGVDYVELRNAWDDQCVGASNVSRYVTFTRDLKRLGPEELLRELPKKTRNMVRKALKSPFEMHPGTLDSFCKVHSAAMRRLGTPAFPRAYFARILENFGPMVDLREVRLNGAVMAASLNFFFRGEMHTYYAAADARFHDLAPNTWMYFEQLRWAGENGCRGFDFGRSKRESGPFEFKRHWNTVMRPLPYEIVPVGRPDLPNVSPANPRFALAIRCWRRLPLAVTRALGPRLIGLFP